MLVTQARYVAPDISGVSKSRVNGNSEAFHVILRPNAKLATSSIIGLRKKGFKKNPDFFLSSALLGFISSSHSVL